MPNGKVLFNGVGQNFGPNGTDFEEATFNFQKMFDPATKKWEIVGPALVGLPGQRLPGHAAAQGALQRGLDHHLRRHHRHPAGSAAGHEPVDHHHRHP